MMTFNHRLFIAMKFTLIKFKLPVKIQHNGPNRTGFVKFQLQNLPVRGQHKEHRSENYGRKHNKNLEYRCRWKLINY